MENNVLLSYIVGLILTGIVYTSISTLLSSLMGNPLSAILAGFLLFIAWYIFDWMILYLPLSTVDILEKFSLSYYIGNIIDYLSNGKAVFSLGGFSSKVSLYLFFKSFIVVLGLILISVITSIIMLERKDIVQ